MNIYRTSTFWSALLVGQIFAWLLASGAATLSVFAVQLATRSTYPSGRVLNIVGFTAHACLAVLAFSIARHQAQRRPAPRGFNVITKP